MGHWYAILVSEMEDVPQVEPKVAIGVDVGLKNMVALSDGTAIQYPRYYVQAEKKLAVAKESFPERRRDQLTFK